MNWFRRTSSRYKVAEAERQDSQTLSIKTEVYSRTSSQTSLERNLEDEEFRDQNAAAGIQNLSLSSENEEADKEQNNTQVGNQVERCSAREDTLPQTNDGKTFDFGKPNESNPSISIKLATNKDITQQEEVSTSSEGDMSYEQYVVIDSDDTDSSKMEKGSVEQNEDGKTSSPVALVSESTSPAIRNSESDSHKMLESISDSLAAPESKFDSTGMPAYPLVMPEVVLHEKVVQPQEQTPGRTETSETDYVTELTDESINQSEENPCNTSQSVDSETVSSLRTLQSKSSSHTLSQTRPERESISHLFRVPSTYATSNTTIQSRMKLQLLPQKKISTLARFVEPRPSLPVPMWRKIIAMLDCTRLTPTFRNSNCNETCNEERDNNDVASNSGNTKEDLDTTDGHHGDNDSLASFSAFADQCVQMEDYTAAFLTDKGGRLSILNSDISIYVPEGALPPGKPQLVELKIEQSKGTPSLDEVEAWLTPTVKCGPPGVKFKKDVFLVLPHCASDISKWNLTHYQSKTGEWSKSKKEESLILQQENSLVVMTDKFCGQKVSGSLGEHDELQTKEMNVSVYLEKGKGKERKLRVCLSNACGKVSEQ